MRVARLDGGLSCQGRVEWNLTGTPPREFEAEYQWDLVLVHNQTGGAAITYNDTTGTLHPDEEGVRMLIIRCAHASIVLGGFRNPQGPERCEPPAEAAGGRAVPPR